MARQRDVAGLPAGRGVDQGEGAGIADQDLIGLRIDPDIVGILAEPRCCPSGARSVPLNRWRMPSPPSAT